MITNYERLANGVIKQISVKKIDYNYDYSNNYNAHGDKGVQFSYLRLGVLVGALGKTPDSILDVGYGNGDFLKVASSTIPNCYGADISDYPVPEKCKKVTLDEKRFYDVICFFDSLEHFDDINFIEKLDCNYIFISVPLCHNFSNSWFEKWHHRKPNEHLWHFNESSLSSHFLERGYERVYSSNYEDIVRKNPESSNYPNILSCLFKKINNPDKRLRDFYSTKRVIVTGGTGFVGRNIVDSLIAYGVPTIYVIDRTLKHSWDNPVVQLIQCDLTKDIDAVSRLDFDILFHEAANVDTTCTDERAMNDINVDVFKKIVDICETKNAKLVYASSAATYGNTSCPNVVGQSESPLNIYGISKLRMDEYIRARNPKRVVGLRYFNVYGGGESHKGSMMSMISQMFNRICENKCVSLFEFGEQKRDFVYVKDVAHCNLLAGMSDVSGIFNCGSGKTTTFNEIFDILNSYVRTGESKINYIKNPYPFFQTETLADMSSSMTALGFYPSYSIQGGIYDFVRTSISRR